MELFQPSVIQIEPSSLNPEAYHQIYQLSLTTDLSSILQTVKHVNQHVYYIFGEPGSGCTTLVQGICQHVCLQPDTFITESDVLYLSLNQLCSEELFYDFITKLAKQRSGTALFKHSSEKIDERKLIIGKFLHDNFKIICIDSAERCSGFIDDFLADVLKACKIPCFVVFNQMKQDVLHSGDFTSLITVKGLNHSDAKSLACKELQPLTLPEDQISKLCDLVHYNPAAIQLVCGLINGCSPTYDLVSVLQNVSSSSSSVSSSCSMDIVVKLISNVLQHTNIDMLESLSCLRRPLPMLEISPAIKELIQMKLLFLKQEDGIHYISVHPVLKTFLMNTKNDIRNTDKGFDCLMQWISLVSNRELCKLIKEAEENAWPFVPEPWQFIDDVREEESFNIKEHIVAKNAIVPSLTELEILHECLYHAYVQDDFDKLAAVTFVLDRFLFWNGDFKLSMAVLDYIQCHSPRTALAPQLFVRRARCRKNDGNLRGAVEVLNMVSKERDRVGHWKYKADYQSQLTKAACIQLNGEVQYCLGNWYASADLLLQSIELFASLPRPDKKGLALGYGLLCPCLRNMTLQDYSKLANTFGLVPLHPLLASYICAKEAAQSSTFTPMHFVRHICHAGEVLLQFIQLSPVYELKQKLLRVAIEDLKDSIQAHQTYKSLTSREQFYILVLASFKLSIALSELHSRQDQKVGHSLKDVAVRLYEHYCSSSDYVPIDEPLIVVIDQCLELLGLEKYHEDNLPKPGQVLQEYYRQRLAQRQENNASLTVQGLFVKSKISLSSPEIHTRHVIHSSFPSVDSRVQVDTGQQHLETVDKPLATLVDPEMTEIPTDGKTVDRLAQTKEDCNNTHGGDNVGSGDGCDVVEEESNSFTKSTSTNTGKSGKTVDRTAATVEIVEKHSLVKATKEKPGQTITFDEISNKNDINSGKSGKTVDRNAVTKDPLQTEENRHKTMDEYAYMMSRTMENDTGVITQSLEHEAVSLVSQTLQHVHLPRDSSHQTRSLKDGILWKYDFASQQWRCSPTMVFIGNPLVLKKELEGNQRDVYHVLFINQDEPLQRYVAKRYRKQVTNQQYENDILSQMTARHYVTMFNDELSKASAGGSVGEIQFLPVVLLQLVDSSGHVTQVFNAEPYMSGEFTKLTNNFDWKDERRRTDLVLAYSHFTYQASDGKLIIVDIQGWAPQDSKGCTYLTDPQIHSSVYRCFGTGNWQQKGFDNFWNKQHPRCNEICKLLQLRRPLFT